MVEFTTPVDIGNRAAQHVGAEMMDTALGFAEVSKIARQVSFVYGKLRRAELERNVWTFATRRTPLRPIDANTMLVVPSLWVAGTSYFAGSIVADGSGTDWISRTQNNLGNQPQNSSAWEPYFGPMTASLYDSATSYFAGEIVYTTSGDGKNRAYLSLQNANSDVPGTATAYSATTTYSTGQVVTLSSVAYMSLIDLNLNNEPDLAPALFNIATTYAAGARVGGSDGVIYQSVGSGNVGHDPTTDLGVHWTNTGVLTPWTTVIPGGTGSLKWLEIGGAEFASGVALTTLNIIYPLGSGPSNQNDTRNVFRLPAGFLREAPQDPKAGSASYLGAPTNSLYNDWVYEGGYIVTGSSSVIILRFVADIQDVTQMKSMFCEGLAARIAIEICEPMTQSAAKLTAVTQAYNKVMSEARTVNAIEAGSEEPPMDDWLACRA